MKLKIIIISLILLVVGNYVGIEKTDGVCGNKGYAQQAIRIVSTKPFALGYWNFYIRYGNKHVDVSEYGCHLFADQPYLDGEGASIDLTPWTKVVVDKYNEY